MTNSERTNHVVAMKEKGKKLFVVLASALMLAWTSPAEVRGAGGDVLTIDEAVRLALQANPDLASLEARARALADVPDQAGALPDPILSFGALNLPTDTLSTTQEPMTQMRIGLNQALPFPGKLSLRRRAAEFESRAARFRYREKQLLLIQDVRTVWWNLFYLDRAIDTVDRNQELFRQLNNIAETKYRVGKGLQQDVLLAQLELSRLLDNRIGLVNMRKNEAIRLNALLDRESAAPVVLPDEVAEKVPELPNPGDLQEMARSGNPALRDMNSRLEAAAARVELARLKYYPDFMAGAAYGFRNGENPDGSDRSDFATFTFSMTLPFFNLTEKERAVSQSRYEEIRRRRALENTENNVLARVDRAISDYRRAVDEIDLLKEGIIPQARQTLDSMLAGYQVNKVDFLNLVRAQTALYNYETRYWKSLSSVNQAVARLSAAVGRENINE